MWWLTAIGMGMQMFGQFRQNMSEATQEEQNADYYRQQAAYARYAEQRQQSIATFEYSQKVSSQTSKYAAGNVDTSGSASTTIGGTLAQMTKELWAIQEKGRMEETLAGLRGQNAQARADMLRDPTYNLLQMGSTGIKGYTSASSYGVFDSNSDSRSKSTGTSDGGSPMLYSTPPPSQGGGGANYFSQA